MPLWKDIKNWKGWKRFEKVLKTFKILKTIINWIVVINAILGILGLVIIVTTRSIEFHEKQARGLTENQKIAEIIKLTILSLRGAQLIFALILFQGTRWEIPCLIKICIIYLLVQIIIDAFSLSMYFTSNRFKVEHFLINEENFMWRRVYQCLTLAYNVIQCFVTLIFYNHLIRRRNKKRKIKDLDTGDDDEETTEENGTSSTANSNGFENPEFNPGDELNSNGVPEEISLKQLPTHENRGRR